jgi:hypothetical protein
VGFETTTPKAPQKLKGFVESYFFIKDQDSMMVGHHYQ